MLQNARVTAFHISKLLMENQLKIPSPASPLISVKLYFYVLDTFHSSLGAVNSFVMQVPVIQKPVYWFAKQWKIDKKKFCHEYLAFDFKTSRNINFALILYVTNMYESYLLH